MPLSKLVFKPGVNRDQTDYASEGGWFDMDKVRFRSGFPEKIGGWRVQTLSAYSGEVRSLFSWNASDGSELIGAGSNEKMYVVTGTNIADITAVRATFTSSTTPSTDNCFTTANASNVVTVNIPGNGVSEGDYVIFSGVTGSGSPATLNNIPITELNAELKVTSVVNANAFTVTVTTLANATSSGGGTNITAKFLVDTGYPNVLIQYGWGVGGWGRNAWGSSALEPKIELARLIYQDNFNNDLIYNISGGDIFYWTYDSTYTNRAVYMREIPGAIAVPEQVTKVMFAPSGHLLAFGCTTYLAANVAGATISSITHVGANATVTTATAHNLESGYYVTLSGQTEADYAGTYQITVLDPTHFTYTMASTPSANASVVGTYVFNDYNGDYDPLMIRWANVDPDIGPEPENWQPLVTNTAGFIRVQSGSKIVAAMRTRQEVVVWTDVALFSLQFLGTTEVFGLQQLASTVSLMGQNSIVAANNIVYWMGNDKFFQYSGRVDTLPCTVRQYVFNDMNIYKAQIFFAGTNSEFNEVVWFYCSANADEIDRYVIYNYSDNIWYFGTIERTAWIDSSVVRFPVAANNGWIYNHELGHDDGQPQGAAPLPIESYIKSADVDIDDGDKFMLIRRVIPDVNFNSSETTNYITGAPVTPEVTITVGVRNFPGAQTATTNQEGQTTDGAVVTQATIDQYTNQVFIRARGRQMNFKISSDGIGVQWQLGMPRIDARPDGLRG